MTGMDSPNDQNPFSTPIAKPVSVESSAPDPESFDQIAKATFRDWEKLRLLYIAILGAVTVVICFFCYPFDLTNLWMILPSAILANLFYMTGPAVDTYVRWLGYREPWPRYAMFTAGTCLSAVLAVAVLMENLK